VVTCRVLGFSPQAYHKWKARPVSARDWADAHLVEAARRIHADDPAFGYRFIADELAAEHGIAASENRVQRLCSSHGIRSVLARKKGRRPKPGEPAAEDLVRREFTAGAPNVLWLVDITEHPTAEGKLYLCAIKDAFSGRIVGYSMDSRMKASLAVAALRAAIALRSPAATVVHSDRGSQFRSGKFVRLLRGGAWSDRSGARGPVPTTPPWSRSSRCSRGTCSTAGAGPAGRSCAWRSSPGSNAPTIAGGVSVASASSRR
jgi:transposase InsO family protein